MINFAVLLGILIVLSIQDIRERQIYDIIPVLGIVAGIILGFFTDRSPMYAVYGLSFGFFALFIPYIFVKVFRKKEGIGFGDVLVSACIGSLLTFDETYFALIFTFLFAVLYCFIAKKQKIALVPFFTVGVICSKTIGVFYEISFFNFG